MAAQLAAAVLGCAVLLLLLAPPGYWLLRRAGGGPPAFHDLGLALGVGWSVMLPLAWVEQWIGAPVVVLPAAGLAAFALRKGWRGYLVPRPDALALLLPVMLAALAFGVNQGDVRWAEGGASFRAGFDVSDRAFYALVGQEVARSPPPAMQNPLFAGTPLAYSFFPPLAGMLLATYAGQDALTVALVVMPTAGFLVLALAVASLLRAWGRDSVGARVLTPLLCVLGGDLSFVFPASTVAGSERSAHFLAFGSFSAEALYYNPWVFALPVALVAIALAGRWLQEGGRGFLWLAAAAFAALWQTKVFAFLPLLLGAVAAGLLLRRPRLLALAAAAAALAAPWAALSLAARAPEFRPLVPAPFSAVMLVLGAHPAWRSLQDLCASASAWVRWPAALASTVLVLAGGLGVRVIGVHAAWRDARSPDGGRTTWVGLSLVSAVVLALSFAGQPTYLDCLQFLMLPQLLLWMYTGPRLAEWIAAGGARRAASGVLVALACVSPLGYVLRKTMPERLTAPSSVDRQRVELPGDALAAARWLAATDPVRANLLVDWRPRRDDPGGRRPLYLAVVSGKRLVAQIEDAHVLPARALERRRLSAEVYETADPARGEALLAALAADWVLEEEARPLRFASPALLPRFRSGGVRIYERVAAAVP